MMLVGDVVRVQSRIKGLYRSRGVMVSKLNVYSVRLRDDWQKQLGSSAQARAARLYDHLDFMVQQKKQADRDLLRESKKHRIVRIVETAPGFGPVRAARLVPIVTRSLSAAPPASAPNQAAVLELLRARDRHALELALGADCRWRLDPGPCAPDARAFSPVQPRAEEHLQGRGDDGDHTAQQGSDLRALRAASGRRHEADAREAQPGAHDRSEGAAHVEERGGVRSRPSRTPDGDRTRQLGDSSIQRARQRAAIRARNREDRSHAALCVAAEVSILASTGPGHKARRSDG
jgi:hypothetical protein